MRRLFLALVLAFVTATVITPATTDQPVSAADCRGINQFNGGHDGPPKVGQNVCTR